MRVGELVGAARMWNARMFESNTKNWSLETFAPLISCSKLVWIQTTGSYWLRCQNM